MWRPFLGVTALAMALFSGCQSASQNRIEAAEQALADAVLVNADDVMLARSERLESGVSFTGELRPVDIVEVGARFDGDLEKILVLEGTRVRKGQSMAVFKPRDVENYRLTAEAEYLAAQATLVSAQNAERRARKLLDAGAAAPSDLEAAEAGRTAAEARVRAVQASLDLAQENAEKLAVPAPISGWVSSIFVHAGDHVAVGDPMLTVVRTDTLELSATIPSESIGRVHRGQQIMIRVDALPAEAFTGILDRINPTTEAGTRQVRIYALVPNLKGRLIGGLFASGRIVETVKTDAVTAPVGVLRREGTDQVAYLLKGGRASRVIVQTGLVDAERGIVELIGPIHPGDSLLSGVVPGLKDSTAIRVITGGKVPSGTPGTEDRPGA
jgi:RND family efflux transporter MFP subunit